LASVPDNVLAFPDLARYFDQPKVIFLYHGCPFLIPTTAKYLPTRLISTPPIWDGELY